MNPKVAYRSASVLFVLSGATSLVYQVIWFKRFSHVWGNSSLAMAAVIASFLLGLGLGAGVVGPLADRVRRPLFWYGLSEIGIALWALVLPAVIRIVSSAAAPAEELLQARPLLLSLVRCSMTVVILGPACFLMGGTLPLIVRQFAWLASIQTRVVGWFYALNTLGGALGCYVAGFHLLSSAGLHRTNLFAAGVNLAVGLLAVAVSRTVLVEAPSPDQGQDPKSAGALTLETVPPVVRLCAFLAGFSALVLEVVWTRQLALVLGSSTYAFTAMLAVFLLGIAAGSLIIDGVLRRMGSPVGVLASVIALTVVGTALGQYLLPSLAALAGAAMEVRVSQVWNATLCLWTSAAVQFLPSLGMGMLFPLVVHLAGTSPETAGRRVGNVYAYSTAGTIVGSIGASLLMMPSLGLANSVRIALFAYALLAVLLGQPRGRRSLAWPAALTALVFVVSVQPFWSLDPRILNSGLYLYGYRGPQALSDESRVLHYGEGSACNVLVAQDEHGHRSLRVNGKVDASDRSDMRMQLGLAYIPRFLHPDARSVLVIGYGSGCTSGASLLFPDTTVTCCEIEPEVVAAGQHFSHVNHEPWASPGFSVVIDDGRSFLQSSKEEYDLILSEPSNPWIAGVSNLFTREFYEAARRRLRPGGMLAQWIQVYSFSVEDYALVVRTLLGSFEHCLLCRVSDGDTILLASADPFGVTGESLDRSTALVAASERIEADLKRYFEDADVRSIVLRSLVADEKGLRATALADGRSAINTDENMRLEFDAPRSLFGVQSGEREIMRGVLGLYDADLLASRLSLWRCSTAQLPALRGLVELMLGLELEERAREIVRIGLSIGSEEPYFLAQDLRLSRAVAGDDLKDAVRKVVTGSRTEAARLGVALWKEKDYRRAIEVFTVLSEAFPDSATLWANLAVNHRDLGDEEGALEALRKALELDPFNAFVEESRKSIDPASREE